MAAKYKIKIDQGATLRLVFTWKTGATQIPVDLTGYTGRMQIRSDISSPDIIKDLTTENGGITLGGVDGKIMLYISALDTATFDFESAVYDIELIAANGDVIRILEGEVTLSPEVTR